jgi:hypothetical protein
LGEDWAITRIEVTGNFGKDEYEAAGGWWGCDWDKYFDFYYLHRPKTQYTVQYSVADFLESQLIEAHGLTAETLLDEDLRQAILTYFAGETIPVWLIEMWGKDELGQHALDLTKPDVRQKLGLPPKTFSDNVEGWRVFLPALITWYGVPRAVPDFSVSLDSDSIKADPGDKVEVTATFKLNDDHPRNEKAILKAFHEVNGTEYPVTLEPVDPADQLNNHIVEFPPGEPKQYKIKVTAQDVSSKVIVKVWPAEVKEDADWSNNSDEAVIEVVPPCADISVTLSRDTSTGEVFTGDEFIMEATIKRGYDGPAGPVDVKNTLDGPGIIDIKSGTITLNQGENKKISWFCQVQNPGTYTYKVTVDPVGVVDCAPGNNSASYTVNVQTLVNDIPKSDKIRGELVH